jgi:hypothetical protein
LVLVPRVFSAIPSVLLGRTEKVQLYRRKSS